MRNNPSSFLDSPPYLWQCEFKVQKKGDSVDMDGSAKDAENGSSSIDQPGEIITKLVSSIENTGESDLELLDILKNHLLKENPTHDAAGRAAKDIWKLATDRATEDSDV